MNKRLVWNFEINTAHPLQLPNAEAPAEEELYWETRFFWPESAIITLHCLNEQFLELSRYQVKHREDIYYLLPNINYNLKQRNEQLLYKPILQQTAQALAFGKKIKLEKHQDNTPLPGTEKLTAAELLNLIKKQSQKILVEKEALIYRLPVQPKTKLELARLKIGKTYYFSVNIESRSVLLINLITQHLFKDQVSSDYVSFLRMRS